MTTALQCVRGCVGRGHLETCADPEHCDGCLPRPASTGLMVCDRCVDGVRKALRPTGRRAHGQRVRDSDLGLPDLWDLVADSAILRSRGTGGRGGDGAPIPLDSAAAAWRDRVRTNLTGWCRILAEDFGSSLDDAVDTVPWMCQKIAFSADRLLAHPEHADQLAADLLGWTDDDVPDGRPPVRHEGLAVEGRRLAFRSRGAAVTIRCSCGGRVPADTERDAIMRCGDCGEWGTLDWWRRREVGQDPAPMSFRDLSEWLLVTHGLTVPDRRLRDWADDGLIVPVSITVLPQGGGRGIRRFDPVAVATVAMDHTRRRRPPREQLRLG